MARAEVAEAPRFAATKIQPARPRAQHIGRAALDAALLHAALEQRIVLLQAPAGFGKTSALASLARRLMQGGDARRALAWVSLDADDDAPRVFACLAEALDPYDLPWRTLPEALVAQMHQGEPAMRRAVEELLNALDRADVTHGVIVFEDLHRVSDPMLVELGNLLVERLPANWTLVLSSRTDPLLALARWRARGELAEFGADALRFSADETAAFVGAEGVADGAGVSAALFQRTQGWPAALRLALLAQKNRGSVGGGALADRYLFDFLASEVLDTLPPPLHDFLVRTSVLPELTAARAAAVSGDLHAAARLDEIERRGLLATPLEASERTLVLHDLLRDALAQRLAQRWPGELPLLLHRAAASEPDRLRRIGYLLRAADWAAAEIELDAAAPELFLQGGPHDVERTLAQFDPAWRDASPLLTHLAANAALLRWDWDAVARLGERALALPEPPAQGAPLQAAARQRTLAVHTMALYVLDRNDAAEGLIDSLHRQPLETHARRLLLIGDATQHFRRGQHAEVQRLYGAIVDSLEQQGATLFEWWECVPAANWSTLPGMKRQIDRFVAGALARLGQRPLALRADILMLQAYGHLWSGRLAEARAAAQAAEDDQRWLACSGETDITLQIFRLIEGTISGRADEVRQRLAQLAERNQDATPTRRRLWQHHIAVYGVRISHALGDGEAEIERWAAWMKEDPLRSSEHHNGRALATRLRHAAAGGRWADAAAHFERLEPLLPNMDVNAHAAELQLRGAQARLRAGDAAAALRTLRPLLERMLNEQTPGYALLAGPVLLAELAQAVARGAADWPPALHDLAQSLPVQAAAARGIVLEAAAPAAAERRAAAAAPPPAAPPAEGLSSREAEVLELIAAGHSNKLIARALDISPHTVKRHVANILGKLGLESRGQAAAWHLRRGT